MNKLIRDAILRGVAGAVELHDALRLTEAHEDGLRAIDVFGVIEELEIPLIFTALDKLLGACVRVSDTEVGILITTQRDLHMQRFTGGHELGHFILEHEGSMDREVRMPGHTDGRDPMEVEADAFAAEFLMPKWLVKSMARRRRWWAADALRRPEIVYQLSLRLATSYEATCWGLAAHTYIAQDIASGLAAGKLIDVKRRMLRGVPLDDSWADVWHLGAGDDGARLDAGPNDVFIVDLPGAAPTAVLRAQAILTNSGFIPLHADGLADSDLHGSSNPRIAFRVPSAGVYALQLPVVAAGVPSTSMSISALGTRRRPRAELRATPSATVVH